MYDVIREWPRYLKVPFPIAKVKTVEVDDDDMRRCIYILFPTIFLLLLLLSCKKIFTTIFQFVGAYVVTYCCLPHH